MNILVTGGSGFLGANVCYEFLKEGNTLISYDLSYKIPMFMKDYENDKKFVYVKGDITDPWTLAATVQKYNITHIIHTATLTNDTDSIPRPYQSLTTPIMAAIHLLEIARTFKIQRLICISSRSAFGSYPPEEGPLGENFTFRPEAFYGASKACIDIILPLYRIHHNVDAVSVRTTAIFGPGQGEGVAGPFGGVGATGFTTPIFNILSSVLRGKPYILLSGGDYGLEVTYVKDLLRGMKMILKADQLKYPTYNISSGKLVKISEYAKMMKKLLPKCQIEIGPGIPEGIKLRAAMDNSRAKAEFGYEHSPLETCIIDFIKYFSQIIES